MARPRRFLAASSLVELAVAAAAAGTALQDAACAVGHAPGTAPVLLQTARQLARDGAAMQEFGFDRAGALSLLPPPVPNRPSSSEAHGGLPPPSKPRAAAVAVEVRTADQQTVSSRAWQHFLELQELRRTGFTCPGGEIFEPNTEELLFDCRLWRAAQLHSADMAGRNFFSHTTPEPDATTVVERTTAQGFPTWHENIAAGLPTPSGTLQQFKESDGHCLTMMDASLNRAGVGYGFGDAGMYKHYWTQLLGADYGEPLQDCYPVEADPVEHDPDLREEPGRTTPVPSSEAPARATTTAPAEADCADGDENCGDWQGAGYCSSERYAEFMSRSCQKSCGVCGPTTTTTRVACLDEKDFCPQWAAQGFCDPDSEYSTYMALHCARSCAKC